MKKAILPLLAVILIVVVSTQTHLGAVLRTGDLEEIASYIQSFGWRAVAISGFVIVLQTFFPFVPFFLLAGVNVIVFGPVGGVLTSWLSAVLGAMLSFLLARYVARDWAQDKVASLSFFQKLNAQARDRGFRIVLMSRLIPVLPSGAVNAAAGLTPIGAWPFFFATLLGKLPITTLESLLGHDVLRFGEHKERLLALLVVLGLLMWIGAKVGKAKTAAPASPASDDTKEGDS